MIIASCGKELEEICRRYHIRRLSLFGSAVRGELRPDSDIDFLVEYAPGIIARPLQKDRKAQFLEAILNRLEDRQQSPCG